MFAADSAVDLPASTTRSAERAQPDSFAPMNRIVSQSGNQTDSETRDLLHQRLRAASIVLAFSYLGFLVQDLVSEGFFDGSFGFQAAVFGLLSLTAMVLFSGWKPDLSQLRILETLVFGSVIVSIAIGLYIGMRRRIHGEPVDVWRLGSFLKSVLACTVSVIYTYAIFIPNDWKRAAKLIVTLGLCPLVVPAVLYLTTPEFRVLVGAHEAMTFENFAQHALLLALGATASIYGVHTINAYRTEAKQARELNQYRLTRRLGSGGMGQVYQAEHHLLKRPCAVKLIDPKLSQNPTALARFELEVRATARLSHENIVELYDYGRTEDGTFYYVMEYLPGLSLQELVDRFGPMPAGRVIHLLRQACNGLSEAHRAGLVHRDLKPPNILAAYRGGRYDVAKVLDFGLVKAISDEISPHLTLEGVVTGSPLYMAPELIVKNHVPDARLDIYALGAIAYFLLTGSPPFIGADAVAVMFAHAREPVEPPSHRVPGVPPDLERVVLQCLEKDPAARFQSAASLARALEQCADADGWSAERAEVWWLANHPLDTHPDDSPTRGVAPDGDFPSLGAGEFDAISEPRLSQALDLGLTIAEDRPPSVK